MVLGIVAIMGIVWWMHPRVEFVSVPVEQAEYVPIYLDSMTEQIGPKRFFLGEQTNNPALFESAFSDYFKRQNPDYKQYFTVPNVSGLPVVFHEGSFLFPIGEYICIYDVLYPSGQILIDFYVDPKSGLIDEINPSH